MAKEAQSSVGYGVIERLATRDVSDFSIGHMAGVRYAEDLPNGPRVKRIIQCDRKGTSLWTTFHTRTVRLELRTSDKDATWYSA